MVMVQIEGPRCPNFLVMLSSALLAFIVVINILIVLLALRYTLLVAACIRTVGPVGPLNRFNRTSLVRLLPNRRVPCTVFVTFLLLGASINAVFNVSSRSRCLWSTALGTARTRWQFPTEVIQVRFTFAPLSAGLTMILLGCSSLCLLVLLTTVSVI